MCGLLTSLRRAEGASFKLATGAELCNKVDDDCDGLIDEDVIKSCWTDVDGDGYAPANATLDPLCTLTSPTCPAGETERQPVGNDIDCDDAKKSVYPGQTETCNLVDDNCNGVADEGVTVVYYQDNDSDGYGNSTITMTVCSPTNMPTANAEPITLPIAALEALRAQVDPNFTDLKQACTSQTDQCFLPSEGPGVCLSPCTGTAGNTCAAGSTATTYLNRCVCVPPAAQLKTCTYTAAPVNGGYDPTTSSLSPSQTLASQYPTLMVHPYYDTQRTISIRGQSRKLLAAMPTFGIYAWHNGTFYGWLNGLVDMSGTPLKQIAPDVYKISVSKAAGVADIRVLLSAEESAHYDTLSEIVGTSVLGAGWGTFQLTATAHTGTVDLRTVKITVQNLLGDGGVERVASLNAPVLLTPIVGATANNAVYTSSARPGLTITVTNLPLIGYLINVVMTGATVNRPNACPFFFGSATLTTQLKIDDGVHSPVTLKGADSWACAPGVLINP